MKCYNHPEREAQAACVYCGKLFCLDCVVEVDGKMYCKPDISHVVKDAKAKAEAAVVKAYTPSININNVNTNQNINQNTNATGRAYYPYKKTWVAALLCFFFGFFGVHRFYVGKVGTGLLWLFTAGLLGVGVLVDFIVIILGGFRDKANMPLV